MSEPRWCINGWSTHEPLCKALQLYARAQFPGASEQLHDAALGAVREVSALLDALATETAKREQAEADVRRMDWLSGCRWAETHMYAGAGDLSAEGPSGAYVDLSGPTLRDAIDAAISGRVQ